jgi:hypothetical protein
MLEIGFEERNRYFSHPDTEYLIEFPQGPLGVGDEQALMVSRENKIDLDEVKRWSEKEGKADQFQSFLKRLKAGTT